jgi:2-keto-4-pentenoate hydratase/2-oxohepta-3-ene-1,7-dioic acid hydratase in catechol pathway
MKFCRFQFEDRVHYGIIENIGGHETVNLLAGDPFCSEIEPTLTHLPLEDIRLLAPVVPSKIVCVGRNYREHAKELGNPVPVELLTFLKPPSSIVGPDEPIV